MARGATKREGARKRDGGGVWDAVRAVVRAIVLVVGTIASVVVRLLAAILNAAAAYPIVSLFVIGFVALIIALNKWSN